MRWFRWLLLAYIILNPLSFEMGIEPRLIQEFFFQISSLIIIAVGSLCSKKITFQKYHIPFIALLLWFLFIFYYFKFGWSIFLNFFLGSMVYMTVIRTIGKEDIKFLLKGIVAVSLLGGIWLGLQYLGYDPRGYLIRNTTDQVPHCSFFNLECSMGMYFALAIPIMLIFSWFSLFMLIPLIFSWSTAAYLGAVAGIFIYYWFRKRIVFWISLIPVLVMAVWFIFFIDKPMGMFTSRAPMWKIVIQDINQSPFVGYGLDSFRNNPKKDSVRYFRNHLNDETYRLNIIDGKPMIAEKHAPMLEELKKKNLTLDFWDNAHNTFIHYAYETGLTFLLLIGVCIYNIGLRFKRSRRSIETVAIFASMCTFLIFSLTQFPFNLARIGYIFPVLLGLFFISTEENDC